MGEDYNVIPESFSGDQLPPSMANSSETDLKKKITKTKPKDSISNNTRS